jgi:hypothetical protein
MTGLGDCLPDMVLILLFSKTADAGLGYADGASFEAIPGLEQAATSHMASILDDVVRTVERLIRFGQTQRSTSGGAW